MSSTILVLITILAETSGLGRFGPGLFPAPSGYLTDSAILRSKIMQINPQIRRTSAKVADTKPQMGASCCRPPFQGLKVCCLRALRVLFVWNL